MFTNMGLEAMHRFSAVGHSGVLGLLVTELLEFGNDVFGCHLLSPSICMERDIATHASISRLIAPSLL
jgi:hypothetical protein